jgi:hypothetical protein
MYYRCNGCMDLFESPQEARECCGCSVKEVENEDVTLCPFCIGAKCKMCLWTGCFETTSIRKAQSFLMYGSAAAALICFMWAVWVAR